MSNPEYYCGVDIGASATKLVLVGDQGQVLARALRHSGVDYKDTARQCLAEAQSSADLEGNPERTVATGYGRSNVDFAADTRTEIHCHGGRLFPRHRTGNFHHRHRWPGQQSHPSGQ